MTPTLIKSFRAASAVAQYLIVRAVANGEVAKAGAGTHAVIGVADGMGVAAAGGMLDVVQAGWAEVKLGGDVSFGDPLTANADGEAVEAAPVAGSVIRTVGFAMADGQDGDVIPVHVVPGMISTPAA